MLSIILLAITCGVTALTWLAGVSMWVWLAFVGVASFFWFTTSQKPPNFPPGPPRLPFVGSLPYLTGGPSDKGGLFSITRLLVGKYGKVAGFWLGWTPTVLISDYDLVKQALKKDELSDRPVLTPGNLIRPGGDAPELHGRFPGIIFSIGQHWNEQRRFALRQLRDFGFGKSSMEEGLLEEARKLVEEFKKQDGKAVDLDATMNISVINALWLILMGETMELDDPKLLKLVSEINNVVRGIPIQSPIAAMLPDPSWAKYQPLWSFLQYAKAEEKMNDLISVLRVYINDHKKTVDQEHPRDFVDVYLNQMKATSDSQSSFYGQRGEDMLVSTLMDFFIAGMETTTTSLLWTILYLMHHPDIQKQVHEELDKVIGRDRCPSLSDMPSLPLTQAVLLESHRRTSLVFVSVPHHAKSDVQLGGYTIPAGSTVLPNLFHIMNDPEYWKDPEMFRPGRFIDDQGQFRSDERVIPFSVGKRYCLGQSLAEKEFFLFFVTLMQTFSFSPVPGYALPGYVENDSEVGNILRAAPAYKTIIKVRE